MNMLTEEMSIEEIVDYQEGFEQGNVIPRMDDEVPEGASLAFMVGYVAGFAKDLHLITQANGRLAHQAHNAAGRAGWH